MDPAALLGDDIYEVNEIVGMKKAEGVWLYRVRWKGYGSHSDTWEPEENLLLCRDMIEAYKTKLAEKTARRQSKSDAPATPREKYGQTFYPVISENVQSPSSKLQVKLADSFWKELAEGKVRIIEEDMYSRVKGRAAKRAVDSKPHGPWGKKRKSGVLQTLSQSYDNAMKSVEDGACVFRTEKPNDAMTYVAKLRLAANEVATTLVKEEILKQEADDESDEKLSWYIRDSSDTEDTEPEYGVRDELCEIIGYIRGGDCERLPILLKPHRTWDDSDSLKLLMAAVSRSNGAAVRSLASAGLNLNTATVDSTTALMFASQNGRANVVLELLEAGALTDLQNSKGETALMLACSGGFVDTVRHLLHYGANFSTVNRLGMNALRLAKLGKRSDIQDLLTYQLSRLTAAFELEVRATVSDTANIIHAVFPLHCFSLNEQTDFNVTFNHELQPLTPGVGYLLFVAHASISTEGVQCRLYGPCSVLSVSLNGAKQPPLTEEANFVFSFCPLADGLNTVTISTAHTPKSMVKLLVCAYKAVLNTEAVTTHSA